MRLDKEVAIRLRSKGKSYNEISVMLNVPKSTLSYWFANARFSKEIKKQLVSKAKKKWAANITRYNKQRAAIMLKRAETIQETESKKINSISTKELWFIGTALYWAEGNKRERWRLKFTNSDPDMIKIMMLYFRKICKVKEEKFRLSLQIHPNISEKPTKEYWHKLTNIPKSQFQKTQTAISKSSKNKRGPMRLPHGTLAVSISDVNTTNKVKGWIRGLANLK